MSDDTFHTAALAVPSLPNFDTLDAETRALCCKLASIGMNVIEITPQRSITFQVDDMNLMLAMINYVKRNKPKLRCNSRRVNGTNHLTIDTATARSRS